MRLIKVSTSPMSRPLNLAPVLLSKTRIKTMSDKIIEMRRVANWGNGLGVLLPRQVLEKMELKAGDKLVLEMENGVITLKKESDTLVIPRYKLEDLLKDYEGYQKMKDFEACQNQEVNREFWKDAEPVGKEVW